MKIYVKKNMSIVCSHVKSTHKLLKKQSEIKLLTLLKMAFEKENFGDDKTKETVFNILNNEII